jgi:hypothetical protein
VTEHPFEIVSVPRLNPALGECFCLCALDRVILRQPPESPVPQIG